ncbi:MAG: HAD-IC family P-type ATPase [Mycobacteriales bacterium]
MTTRESVGTLPAGLTAAEVAERVAAGQVNRTGDRASRSTADIVRANVLTRFNAIIGVLFAVIAVIGPWQDGLFGLVVLANTAIGIVQELRAKRTLDRLSVVGEARPRVRRDGTTVAVPTAEVVAGDLVVVGAGDQLVVDGPVVAGDAGGSLEVDESLLTGESDPVLKRPGDRLLSGSFVVAGGGAYRAEQVGREAYAARLAAEARDFSLARSELRAGVNLILRYVSWAMVPVGALLIVSQLRSNDSLAEALRSMVAGLVTMVPEGLVLLTSMAFAVGVIRLGRRRCLVQELPAIEGLARVDVVCADKTGTLTAKGMRLREVVTLDGALPARDALGALAHADPSPNASAAAIAAALPAPDGWPVDRYHPFSSARKWSGAEFADRGVWLLGAPDVLLPAGVPARERAEAAGAGGLRVLLLATADAVPGGGGERAAGVRPAALVVLEQRIRPDAAGTLRYFAEQGVAVKVISGDNAASVGAVAAALDLPGADHPVDARTLPEDPEELAATVERASVYGRVTPAQKRAMVRALHRRGHTVAMTGDGVNDVLALKDADVGVAMGSGSGATRAVAQIVLLDDSFATLPAVVAEGRRVVGNIERVARLFVTKTMYSLLLSVLVGVAHLPFPFLPRHLSLVGGLSIGIPGFFLALAPSRDRARPGFVRRVLRGAVPAGVLAAAATFAAYALARANHGSPLREDRTTAVIALSVVVFWLLAIVARPWVWWRVCLVVAMAALLVGALFVPFAAHFFALYPQNLDNNLIGLGIGAAAAVLLTISYGK